MEDTGGLKKKIRALIAFRVIFITFFFGSTFFFWGFRKFPYLYPLSYLIILLYGITIIYAFLLDKVKNLVAFAYVQLISDVIFEILLIYLTGGIDSWFSFILIIIVFVF